MKSTPVPPESVVVGYDGSTGSDLALDWAVAEARRTTRPLHLVRASGRHAPRGFEPSAELDAVTHPRRRTGDGQGTRAHGDCADP